MFNNSVDKIVGVFTKAISDLESLEQTHSRANNLTQQAIDVGVEAITTRNKEIARSKAIRENLLKITAGM